MAIDYGGEQVVIARTIARIAHRGQVDKGGSPYIEHPARVAEAVAQDAGRWSAVAAAWLHDVIEDSPFTDDDLDAFGVDAEVIHLVVLLTRTPDVSADDYYGAIRGNFDARKVKRADVLDNLNPRRLAKLDDVTVARLTKKYAKALDALDGK